MAEPPAPSLFQRICCCAGTSTKEPPVQLIRSGSIHNQQATTATTALPGTNKLAKDENFEEINLELRTPDNTQPRSMAYAIKDDELNMNDIMMDEMLNEDRTEDTEAVIEDVVSISTNVIESIDENDLAGLAKRRSEKNTPEHTVLKKDAELQEASETARSGVSTDTIRPLDSAKITESPETPILVITESTESPEPPISPESIEILESPKKPERQDSVLEVERPLTVSFLVNEDDEPIAEESVVTHGTVLVQTEESEGESTDDESKLESAQKEETVLAKAEELKKEEGHVESSSASPPPTVYDEVTDSDDDSEVIIHEPETFVHATPATSIMYADTTSDEESDGEREVLPAVGRTEKRDEKEEIMDSIEAQIEEMEQRQKTNEQLAINTNQHANLEQNGNEEEEEVGVTRISVKSNGTAEIISPGAVRVALGSPNANGAPPIGKMVSMNLSGEKESITDEEFSEKLI